MFHHHVHGQIHSIWYKYIVALADISIDPHRHSEPVQTPTWWCVHQRSTSTPLETIAAFNSTTIWVAAYYLQSKWSLQAEQSHRNPDFMPNLSVSPSLSSTGASPILDLFTKVPNLLVSKGKDDHLNTVHLYYRGPRLDGSSNQEWTLFSQQCSQSATAGRKLCEGARKLYTSEV